jgi:hypothetical protein
MAFEHGSELADAGAAIDAFQALAVFQFIGKPLICERPVVADFWKTILNRNAFYRL